VVQVEIVSVNLAAITAPVPMLCKAEVGARMMSCGGPGGPLAPSFKIRRMGPAKSGNQNRARWRTRQARRRSDWSKGG
jgi:hypothetical protein